MWRLCFSPSLAPIQSVSLWHGTIYTSEICWVCIALLADSPDETITPSFFPRAKNFFIFALSNFSCNICASDEWMSSPCLFERKWYKSNKLVKQVEDNVRNIWLIIYWSNHKIQKQDFFHFPQTSLLICRHKKKLNYQHFKIKKCSKHDGSKKINRIYFSPSCLSCFFW